MRIMCVTKLHLLRIVRSVEVVPCNRALRAGHIPSNDEVRAPEVLADHHVLDGLGRGTVSFKDVDYSKAPQELRWCMVNYNRN